ncbi:MAG TPA: heavy metal translocating P-type ATPase [Kofleriaceae bacterium]
MSETTTIDLPVLGMTCAACVRRVERAVAAVPGVTSAEVNLPLSRARLVVDPELANAEAAIAAIRAAGYEVPADVLDAPAGERLDAERAAVRDEDAALRRDAVLAIALAIPLIALAMLDRSVVAQLVLGTVIVLVPGWRFLRGGWIAVRHGAPDMNTLIALGAGAAWLSSAVAAARWLADPHAAAPAVYFDAAGAIVAFVMIGKLLESRARARVADAVRGLYELAPARARVLDDAGDEREVAAAELAAGDRLAVRPGERLAADGTIVEGASAIDESLLTGEALPVDKAEGAPVYAGTLNHHGALVVRVARAGADTALARIARAVADAQGHKAPIARLADRVSAWFVPAVLAIAAATCVGWLLAGAGGSLAIERAVAVLVIACPCALGLATPAAVAVGTARGAELGVLFSGGDALERASAITVACLDKTGTLTAGTPALVGEVSDELLALAASAEQGSEHPIARAIVDAAKARGLALVRPTDVVVKPGAGITARVDGRDVAIAATDASDAPYASSSQVVVDGTVAGTLSVADPPAPAAKATIAALRELGVEPVMITGDREPAARWIADAVGISRVHARVLPTGKAALVTQERGRGQRVAMIGDGINDAPALAAADLGVALGSGTDIAAAAADVTLLRGGIATLPTALGLARATLHVIRRNLIAAFAYNALCIPIAALGFASPMLASAAMSVSSVSVLASSLALRRFTGARH